MKTYYMSPGGQNSVNLHYIMNSKSNRLKLSRNVEKNLKLNQKTLSASRLPKLDTCKISGTAEGNKLEFPENV